MCQVNTRGRVWVLKKWEEKTSELCMQTKLCFVLKWTICRHCGLIRKTNRFFFHPENWKTQFVYVKSWMNLTEREKTIKLVYLKALVCAMSYVMMRFSLKCLNWSVTLIDLCYVLSGDENFAFVNLINGNSISSNGKCRMIFAIPI